MKTLLIPLCCVSAFLMNCGGSPQQSPINRVVFVLPDDFKGVFSVRPMTDVTGTDIREGKTLYILVPSNGMAMTGNMDVFSGYIQIAAVRLNGERLPQLTPGFSEEQRHKPFISELGIHDRRGPVINYQISDGSDDAQSDAHSRPNGALNDR